MVLDFKSDVEKVYDEYADMMYRIALTHSRNSHDAMDAVQDVFGKYASSPRFFADEEHRKAWLVRSTVNRCLDIFRMNKVRAYVALEEAVEVPDDESPLFASIKLCVDNLPEQFKTVVVLHYLEGFSLEEIATSLKLSVSAVKMRLSRAREFLKETYKEDDFYV